MKLLDRVVVIGAGGQLGTDLMAAFRDVGPTGVEHKFVDIEHSLSLHAMFARYAPTLVLNTAAYHNVELCETFPDRAFAVNALGVDTLAAACATSGAVLLHVSTDYVFDGAAGRAYTERDATGPLNAYGVSKVAGESLLRRHGDRHFIVRTCGLYGRAGSSTKGYTFIEMILGKAQRGESIRVVDDVASSPSYTKHVAAAIRQIVDRGEFGLYHVANAGACSWFDFASEILRQAKFDADLQRTNAASFGAYAKRPAYSALALDAYHAAGFETMPSWQDGIAAYLAEKASRPG